MKRTSATIALAAIMFFSLGGGTSLAVTFTGSPALVARAEQWQAKSEIPLGDETVALVPIAGFCLDGVQGCSQMPQYTPDGVGQTAATTRDTLYFELGHQLDWSLLTPANRRFLARKWGDPHWHWFDSATSIENGTEDGLEGMFGQMVESCAFGHPEFHTSIAAGTFATSSTPLPTINPGSFDTCSWLERIVADQPTAG